MATPTTTYKFAYGAFSLRSSVKIGGRTLAAYTYTNDRNNYLQSLAYGNGDSVQYTYDEQGRVTKQTYEDGAYVSYQYDNSGALATVYDSASGIKTTYYYDTTGRLMRYMEQGTNNSSHIVRYMYDNINNLTSQVEIINGTAHQTNYTYDDDNRVTASTVGNLSRSFSYDGFGRLITRNTTKGDTTVLAQRLFYRKPATGTTTGQVGSIKYTYGGTEMTLTYGYDKNGNITSVSDGTNTTRYYYDSANQLIRENNKAANKTWVWTYDNAGNILSKKEYAYTTGTPGTPTSTVNYAYDDSAWGDLLTAYDGKTIESDAIGNPTKVKQGNTTIRTYSWRNGRELASMTSGGNTWTFTYNADGIRTKRVSGGATYTYVYNGSSLSQMNVGNDSLYFIYDASGTPTAVVYNGTTYYYQTNLQGDVIAILNGSGTKVVEYTYDAWGKVLSRSGSMASTLGSRNPLRYRGYVYDAETALYYLQSRYYDPEMGRFINADAFTSTGQGLLGNNMFAYCLNNPVNAADPTGHCSYFLFFKIDCFSASCPSSQCYNPDAPSAVVIYDGRVSGTPWWLGNDPGDEGFAHQGQELMSRLSGFYNVTGYAYTTMDEFVEIWNSLDGSYDTIYILGHGQPGKFNARGGSLRSSDSDYSYSDLASVDVAVIYLYICNGDTSTDRYTSTAYNFANLTGANVHAVSNGKLNFTWNNCFPYMHPRYWLTGHWTMTSMD